MTLNERICEAIKDMMVEQYRLDVTKVLSWEDKIVYSGYCETCRYEEQVVEVLAINSGGTSFFWEYSGTFADLMNRL